ncbi:hypothetical protein SAMN06298216_0911 [Spirosomataceae bacterium TFI 002]|nr:hypothetical protein SAMN06298216_0911 [Spirosomataceae bacterium TFI 002]
MYQINYQRWGWGEMQDVLTSIEVLDGYNKTRFNRRKTKNLELLIEAAKHAHEHGLIYFVTIRKNENPYCYFENNKAFFRVSFLDEHLRTYMSYDFTNKSEVSMPEKLFLSVVTIWDFKGDSDKVVKITDYKFHTDGKFVIVERDHIKNEQTNSEAKNKIDVSANWEDYPGFGKYDSIIRIERGLNMVLETKS